MRGLSYADKLVIPSPSPTHFILAITIEFDDHSVSSFPKVIFHYLL